MIFRTLRPIVILKVKIKTKKSKISLALIIFPAPFALPYFFRVEALLTEDNRLRRPGRAVTPGRFRPRRLAIALISRRLWQPFYGLVFLFLMSRSLPRTCQSPPFFFVFYSKNSGFSPFRNCFNVHALRGRENYIHHEVVSEIEASKKTGLNLYRFASLASRDGLDTISLVYATWPATAARLGPASCALWGYKEPGLNALDYWTNLWRPPAGVALEFSKELYSGIIISIPVKKSIVLTIF